MDTTPIDQIIQFLSDQLRPLIFGSPVHYVYNPLDYARLSYIQYWRSYGLPPKEVIFLGMNPGPWGMVQTGVPFGDRGMVKEWLNIQAAVGTPERIHPKRPVMGFDCPRGEVSGQRLWGWVRSRFKTPERFFKRFWVANYCPLAFIEGSGRNRTPDQLPKMEKEPLLAICDQALVQTVQWLKPQIVVGIGRFAAQRARRALSGMDMSVGQITHPSPASPKANRGWSALIEKELAQMGIDLGIGGK